MKNEITCVESQSPKERERERERERANVPKNETERRWRNGKTLQNTIKVISFKPKYSSYLHRWTNTIAQATISNISLGAVDPKTTKQTDNIKTFTHKKHMTFEDT